MKATALILSLLAVGSLVAAEVAGNNTAVVIQKSPVVSATKYQFICVPVNGLDITGGGSTDVSIVDLLPPASYDANTKVYKTDSTGAIGTTPDFQLVEESVTVDEVTTTTKVWMDADNNTLTSESTAGILTGGTVLWVNTSTYTSEDLSNTVFCGEERTSSDTAVAYGDFTSGKMTQVTNSASEALPISTLITGSFVTGDEILRLQNGTNNYQHFVYNTAKGSWRTPGSITVTTSDALTIPAGEAFYFVAK